MNRRYAVRDFREIVEYLKAAVPGVTLSTDIIVGFPYETAADHAATMALLKELRLDIVHYSRYYARPHTVAARFEQLPMAVVKPRVKELSDWFKGLDPYAPLVGKLMPVWVASECVDGARSCHTKEYIKVMMPDAGFRTGDVLLVRATAATRFHLEAEVVDALPRRLRRSACPRELMEEEAAAIKTFF